jgi:hypothetical protein
VRVPLVDKLAERHPGLRRVMDRRGLTFGLDEEAFPEPDKLLAIGKRSSYSPKNSRGFAAMTSNG